MGVHRPPHGPSPHDPLPLTPIPSPEGNGNLLGSSTNSRTGLILPNAPRSSDNAIEFDNYEEVFATSSSSSSSSSSDSDDETSSSSGDDGNCADSGVFQFDDSDGDGDGDAAPCDVASDALLDYAIEKTLPKINACK